MFDLDHDVQCLRRRPVSGGMITAGNSRLVKKESYHPTYPPVKIQKDTEDPLIADHFPGKFMICRNNSWFSSLLEGSKRTTTLQSNVSWDIPLSLYDSFNHSPTEIPPYGRATVAHFVNRFYP